MMFEGGIGHCTYLEIKGDYIYNVGNAESENPEWRLKLIKEE